MASVKQGGIKDHFLSLWYESTWDWTSVFWTIDKHFNHQINGPVKYSSIKLFIIYIAYFPVSVLFIDSFL